MDLILKWLYCHFTFVSRPCMQSRLPWWWRPGWEQRLSLEGDNIGEQYLAIAIKQKSLTCWHNNGWHRFNREKTNLNLGLVVPPEIHLSPSDDIQQDQDDDGEGGKTITDHVVDYRAQALCVEDDNKSSVEKVSLNYWNICNFDDV